MTNDFNLSEKLRHSHNEQDLVTRHIHIEEIKEFIKRLRKWTLALSVEREDCDVPKFISIKELNKVIDNLAGDDLK